MDRRELYSLTGSVVRIVVAGVPAGSVAFMFTVESAADTTAVLRPCDRDAKEFAAALPSGERLQLTVGSNDGVFEGTLIVDRWLVASRMLMVSNPPLSFAQRRDYFRVPVALPIELGLVRDGSVQLAAATTVDMSQGGCAFTLRDEVVARELAAVVIRLEERAVLAVLQIVGVPPDRKLPVRARFHQITPYDRTALATELRRHEVARVRTGR